jgi:hypothetical protein
MRRREIKQWLHHRQLNNQLTPEPFRGSSRCSGLPPATHAPCVIVRKRMAEILKD